MADFYRTNGNVGTVGTFVSFIGKTPKAFGLRVVGTAGPTSLVGELGVNGAMQDILKTVSSNITVLGFQVESGTNGNVSLLIEGGDYVTATNLQAIIRTGGNGAGGYGNSSPQLDAGLSLVSDVGFKLATS